MKKLGILLFVVMMIAACRQPAEETIYQPRGSTQKAAEINVQLGLGYLNQGEVQRAKHKLLMAMDQNPSSVLVLDAMAYFYEKTSEIDKANEYYQRAVRLSSSDGMANNNYGIFLCRQNNYADAEQYFLRAVKDRKYLNVAGVYENAGNCALKAKQKEKGIQYLQRAVEHDPNHGVAIISLADIAYRDNQIKQAEEYMNQYMNVMMRPTAEGVWLAYQIAVKTGNQQKKASYGLILKTQFAESREYALLKKKES